MFALSQSDKPIARIFSFVRGEYPVNAPAPVNAPGETACYLLEYKGVSSIGLGFGLVHVHGMDRSRPEKLRRYPLGSDAESASSPRSSTIFRFFSDGRGDSE